MSHNWGLRSGKGTYKNSQFSRYFEAFGAPRIIGSHCLGGQVFGEPVITNTYMDGIPVVQGEAEITDSVILGSAKIIGSPVLTDSSVADFGVVADHAFLFQSDVAGNARVLDHAVLKNTMVTGNALIKGSAQIVGPKDGILEIGEYIILDRGLWTRAPIHFICNSGYSVTESENEYVTVSCTTNTTKKWLSGAGRRYGKLMGMTEEEIDEVQYYVEAIAKEKGI